MSQVHDIDEVRPHMKTPVTCKRCGHYWIAVHLETVSTLECPGCHGWVNEYGTPVSVFVCATCKRQFSVCPETEQEWEHCLADTCASYDPRRDVDRFLDLVRRGDEEPKS